MIEPCFNELSVEPFCNTAEEVERRVATFIDLLKKIEKLGIKRTRYENSFTDIKLQENYSLLDYCENVKNPDQRNFLYSHMRRPYMDDDKEFFTYSDYKFVTDEGKEFDCIGLYVSHITKSFAVGFDAGLFEGSRHIECRLSLIKNDEKKTTTICCLTLPQHLNNDLFVELMSEQEDLPVPSCEITPKDKKIHISAHHGKKECEAHADRLVKCKYVKEVLNSIDFNPSEKNYIHKVDDKNLIEVRLVNTKSGYGLCISTTATNKIQNHWIAKYLKREFSK